MDCYSRPDSLMRPDREMGQSNSNFHLASTLGKFLFSKGEQFGLEALELSVMSETGHTMRLDMGTRTSVCACWRTVPLICPIDWGAKPHQP